MEGENDEKIRLYFLVFVTIIGIYLLYSWQKNGVKYPIGRDTYEVFGNGRFQLSGDNDIYNLHDSETHDDIEDDVYRYRKIKEFIYVVGQCGYSVVNFESGEIVQSQNLAELPEEYVEIFNDVDTFKIFKDKK